MEPHELILLLVTCPLSGGMIALSVVQIRRAHPLRSSTSSAWLGSYSRLPSPAQSYTSEAYALAVDEVNAIERAILGRDAYDIPRRRNPSLPFFGERPVSYFVTPPGSKPYYCVHYKGGFTAGLLPESSWSDIKMPDYDYRRIEECPEHAHLVSGASLR